jgi:hypothetical protein
MERFDIGAVGEVTAATETARHHRGSGLALLNGRKEAVSADLHGKLIVLFLVAEGTGHTAATGIHLRDGHTSHAAKQLPHGAGAAERFLMAMAVDENLAERRFKCTVQTALVNLQREELIDHHYVLFHTPAELFIINQIGHQQAGSQTTILRPC